MFGQHGDVHPAQHGQHPTDTEWIVRLCLLTIAINAVVVGKEFVDVLLDEDVALHQHEAVRQQFPQLLYGHHVLGAAELATFGTSYGAIALRELGQLLIEVDNLALRIVQNCQTTHASHERALCGVVEDGDVITLSAMLAK